MCKKKTFLNLPKTTLCNFEKSENVVHLTGNIEVDIINLVYHCNEMVICSSDDDVHRSMLTLIAKARKLVITIID